MPRTNFRSSSGTRALSSPRSRLASRLALVVIAVPVKGAARRFCLVDGRALTLRVDWFSAPIRQRLHRPRELYSGNTRGVDRAFSAPRAPLLRTRSPRALDGVLNRTIGHKHDSRSPRLGGELSLLSETQTRVNPSYCVAPRK